MDLAAVREHDLQVFGGLVAVDHLDDQGPPLLDHPLEADVVHVHREVGVLAQGADDELPEHPAGLVFPGGLLRHAVVEVRRGGDLHEQPVLRAEELLAQPLDQVDVLVEVGHRVAEQGKQHRLVPDEAVAQLVQLGHVLLDREVELHRQQLVAELPEEGQGLYRLQAQAQHLRAHVDGHVVHLRVRPLEVGQHHGVLLPRAGAEADVVVGPAVVPGVQAPPAPGEGLDPVPHDRVVGVRAGSLPVDRWFDSPVRVPGHDPFLVTGGREGALQFGGQFVELAGLVLAHQAQRPGELGFRDDLFESAQKLQLFPGRLIHVPSPSPCSARQP
ncbi:hypothetical protein RMN56_06120 [Micromonospora halotolerans]|uniref:Uncharacterized protein n=1 Tax=Micromonospora halotolerans TaxID=709879 RepID=A0ABZ0A064_9ACTN|nr:hypothetical protein [Micromonospora halotolerans]WNM40924.1 hypothetical protein RMN56_06120 [Micromonospora halotolerans]